MSDVVDKDHGYKAMLRAIFGMETGVELTVGIHEGLEGEGRGAVPTERKVYRKKKSDGGRLGGSTTVPIDRDSIATYAAANEFGTEHIPARPWMRTCIDGNQKKYAERIVKAMQRALAKGISPAVTIIDVGRVVRNDLIHSIKGGGWEADAPETALRKGSTRPLVDTGAMQRAITFKVRKR